MLGQLGSVQYCISGTNKKQTNIIVKIDCSDLLPPPTLLWALSKFQGVINTSISHFSEPAS
jgi:hypothetical protein